MTSDTIAAIATSRGEASVGIVRVSGDEAGHIVERIFRTANGRCFQPRARGMRVGMVVDPRDGRPIDECILLWMPGPKSYTAEDVAEFQIHGGMRVVEAVLEGALVAGARLAEPGEFTKRAFLNGRIDLSQAEAVIDLIRAKTDLASRAALRQVQGHLRDTIRGLRRSLIRLQAHVEVTLDYPEHDVESLAREQVRDVVSDLLVQIQRLLASARMGRIVREGIATVIVGRPNVGKSSLLNGLLRRDRAIVTDVPGTTRDILEEFINVHGVPFRVIDTAGIRETTDIVERIGVERSRDMLHSAELVIVVLNGNEPIHEDDLEILRVTKGSPRIVVVNKADLPTKIDMSEVVKIASDDPVLHLSVQRSDDIDRLEEAMMSLVMGGEIHETDLAYLTNTRQTMLLRQAEEDLEQARRAAEVGATLDLIAVQLQSAYASLGLVIGEEVGEDLLDEIFSQFCLGK